MSHRKPEGYVVFLALWIAYAVVACILCIRMIFNHNNSWHQPSHRNGILWGLFFYLVLRFFFYSLYLADDERSMGNGIYFLLIDGPTLLFFVVYTQLVLYWAQMVGSSKFEQTLFKKGYYVMMGILAVVLIIDIVYRVRNSEHHTDDDTTRYVYGLTIGTLSLVLAAGFLHYGWRFYLYLDTLPEGDVRRRRLPRILAAMALFSAGFVVYGCFIIFCYSAGYNYLPGTNTNLTQSQKSAIVFRSMDVYLASLILYIVQRPGKLSDQFWRSKTFNEPLLESDSACETLTAAATRQGLVSSMSDSGSHEERPSELEMGLQNSPREDRRALAHAALVHEARQGHLTAMGQPMTMSSVVPESSFALTPSGCQEDFPYRDRVMKHYRSNYASFSGSGSEESRYEPPVSGPLKAPQSPEPAPSPGASEEMGPVSI